MSDLRGAIPILRLGDVLISSVHVDLHDAVAEAFQADVLTHIEKTGAKGLVIDVSGLEMVDSYVARILADTGRMAKLMGTQMVLVGMRPTVAITLVELGLSLPGVDTALNVERGVQLLNRALA